MVNPAYNMFGGGGLAMATPTEPSLSRPLRIVHVHVGITFVSGLLLGVVLTLLTGWNLKPKPKGQQINISNSTGVPITVRTENGSSFELEPSRDTERPILLRPGEPVTFEASINGTVISQRVTPLWGAGDTFQLRADMGLSDGNLRFRFRNPE
jgi:hypothetical protein